MPKFSQIAPAGAPPAVTDQAVFVTGGATDNLVTVTQLGAALPIATTTTRGQVPVSGGGITTFLRADISFAVPPTFTSTTPGYAPLSGGGTTNFLRADGTWAAPPGGTPGGSSLQIQYNNAGAFGGANVWRTGANQLDLSNGAATAQQLRVYNSTDNNGGAPINAEWGTVDWITAANLLIIGAQSSGTGVSRSSVVVGSTTGFGAPNQGGGTFASVLVSPWTGGLSHYFFAGSTTQLNAANILGWVNSNNAQTGGFDTGLSRTASKVVQFGDGGANSNGWMQWQGQARIDADFNTGNSTVLANITGSSKNLSVTLQAGRTYSFRVELFTTSNVAAGVQFAIAGTCTATNIIYEALVDDAAAVKAQTKATALATAVGAVTAVTSAHCNITGTITVNAAGTLTVQAAQNVGNATGTVVQRGSYMIVQDMP